MRAGVVTIEGTLLLQFLQFQGGMILDANCDGPAGTVSLVIEHPEMPETPTATEAKDVMTTYIKHADGLGNSVAVREPLKEE